MLKTSQLRVNSKVQFRKHIIITTIIILQVGIPSCINKRVCKTEWASQLLVSFQEFSLSLTVDTRCIQSKFIDISGLWWSICHAYRTLNRFILSKGGIAVELGCRFEVVVFLQSELGTNHSLSRSICLPLVGWRDRNVPWNSERGESVSRRNSFFEVPLK